MQYVIEFKVLRGLMPFPVLISTVIVDHCISSLLIIHRETAPRDSDHEVLHSSVGRGKIVVK